jgi:hypothetical protein
MTPSSDVRPISFGLEPEEEVVPEEVVQEPQQQAPQAPEEVIQQPEVIEPPSDVRKLEQPKALEAPQQELSKFEHFLKGTQRSAAGEAGAALSNASGLFEKIPRQDLEEKEPGFWNSIIEEAGTLTGDLPFMGIGRVLGAALGSAVGPLGSTVGGHAGAFAFPEFVKELSRQYRDFEDNGGDLSFGEFIKYDQLMNKTLTTGAFGSILGNVQAAMPFLSKVPVIKQLFDTKYLGKILETGTSIGAEVGAATVIPAAVEGRLPTKEDVAKAAVLFTGTRAAHLPRQLYEVIKTATEPKFNFALADKVQELDLAYPPLQEFKMGENPIYKNSVELDRNLTAFDKSVIDNVASKIETLSPNDLVTSDQAGREMFNRLGPLVAVAIPPREAPTPEPAKPNLREIPAKPELPPKPQRAEFVFEEPPAPELPAEPEQPSPLKPEPAPKQPTPLQVEPPPELPAKPEKPEPLPGIAEPETYEVALYQNPLKTAIDTISGNAASTKSELGNDISEAYHQGRKKEQDPLQKRYKQQENELGALEFNDSGPLIAKIEGFADRFEPGAIPGSSRATIVSAARRLLNAMVQYDENGGFTGHKKVSVQKIIEINKSLKEIPNYDVPPEMLDNVIELTQFVDQSVRGYIEKVNPVLAQEFSNLNADYSKFKQRWDNEDMRVFWKKTEKGEAIVTQFSSFDKFKQLDEALGGSHQGQKALNFLRRDVWKERIGKDALHAKTEQAFSKSLENLSNEDYRNMMKFLTPEQREIALEAMEKTNQIRSSAVKTSEMFARERDIHGKKKAKREEREAKQKVEYEKKVADWEAKIKKEKEDYAEKQRQVKAENDRMNREYQHDIAEWKTRTKKDQAEWDKMTRQEKEEWKENTKKKKEEFAKAREEKFLREQARHKKEHLEKINEWQENKKTEKQKYEAKVNETRKLNAAEKETHAQAMKEWRQKELERSERQKKLQEEVQIKQQLLVSLLQQDPAKLVGNMNSIEGIRRIKDATKKVDNGKELYDSLAKYETNQMFKFMQEQYVRTGRVPYTDMKLRLKDKEFRAKLKELNGEKFVKEMDEIVDLTDKLSKNFKEKVVEYRDDPTVLNTILNVYSIYGLASGDLLTPLMAYTAKKNLLKMGGKGITMWSNKKNYDPENIHKVLNAARAVNNGSRNQILKASSELNIPYQSQ